MYSIEPAYLFYNELQSKLLAASKEKENQWFFTGGAFDAVYTLDTSLNTGKFEKFVVISDNQIKAYFTGIWNRSLLVFDGFSIINFSKTSAFIFAESLIDIFYYLFVIRGCKVISWLVAEKNVYALSLYRKFIANYFGREIGRKTRGQKGYSGEISDVIYFEITDEQFNNFRSK